MLFGLRETTEPLRVVAIFAGFKYGHVTMRYSRQRDLWPMPRRRMAPPGGLSVLPGPVLAGGESSEWATRITLIPRFQTPHEPSQPQSRNRTLRNGSASDRGGPTPRKDEHTGKSVVTDAIPRIVYRKCVTEEPFPFKVGNSHKQMTLASRHDSERSTISTGQSEEAKGWTSARLLPRPRARAPASCGVPVECALRVRVIRRRYTLRLQAIRIPPPCHSM
jgi:hypothetical protein